MKKLFCNAKLLINKYLFSKQISEIGSFFMAHTLTFSCSALAQKLGITSKHNMDPSLVSSVQAAGGTSSNWLKINGSLELLQKCNKVFNHGRDVNQSSTNTRSCMMSLSIWSTDSNSTNSTLQPH